MIKGPAFGRAWRRVSSARLRAAPPSLPTSDVLRANADERHTDLVSQPWTFR
jgi:hypothetical protein